MSEPIRLPAIDPSSTSSNSLAAKAAAKAAAREAKRLEKRKLPMNMAQPQYYSRRCDYAVIPIDTRYTEPSNYMKPQVLEVDPLNQHEVELNWNASHRAAVVEYEEKEEKGGYSSYYEEALRNPHTYLTTAAIADHGRPVFNDEIDRDSIDSNSEEDEDDDDDDEEDWWYERDGIDCTRTPDSDEDEEEDTQGAIVVDYHDLEVEIMPRLKRVTKLSSDMCEIVCSYLDPDADFGLLLEDIALLVVRTLDTIDEYREQSKKYFNEFLPSPSKEALKENLPEETKKEMLEIEEEQKKLKDEAKEQKEQNEQKKEDHEKMDESFSSDDEVIGSHYSYPVRLYLCSDSRQYLRELESILNLTLAPRMSISIIMDAVRKCIKNDTTNETLSRQRLMLMYDWFQRDYDGWEECLTQFEHRIAVIEEEWHFASDVLMVCGYLLDSRPSSNFYRNDSPYRVRYLTPSDSLRQGPVPQWHWHFSSSTLKYFDGSVPNEPNMQVEIRTLNQRNCLVPINASWLLRDLKLLVEEQTLIPILDQQLTLHLHQVRSEDLVPPLPLHDDNKTLGSYLEMIGLDVEARSGSEHFHIHLNSNVKRWLTDRTYLLEGWEGCEWKGKRIPQEEDDQVTPEKKKDHDIKAWQIEPIDTQEEQESSELLGSSLSDAHQALIDEFSRLELLHPAPPIVPPTAVANDVLETIDSSSGPPLLQQSQQPSQQSNPLPLSQQSHISVLSRVSYALEQRLHEPLNEEQEHSHLHAKDYHIERVLFDWANVDPEVTQAEATLARVWKWIFAVQPWRIEKDEEGILGRPMFATIAPLIRDLKTAIASPCYAYDANPTPSKSTLTVSNSSESAMEIDNDGTTASMNTVTTIVSTDETTLVQPTKKMKLDHSNTTSASAAAASSTSSINPPSSSSPSSSSSSLSSSSIYTGELCIFRRLQTREKYAAAEKLLVQMNRVFHLQPWLGMNDTSYLSELTEVTESLRRTMAQYYLTHMTRSESLDDEIRGINQQLSTAAETRGEVSHDAVFDRHDFSLLVHEVGQDYKNDLNFTPAALQILQEASETELVKHFRLAKRVRDDQHWHSSADSLYSFSRPKRDDEPVLEKPLKAVQLKSAVQIDNAVYAEYIPSNSCKK